MNVVVKISSNLINPDNSVDVLDKIAKEVSTLRESGTHVVIVTSGAVMYGMKRLGFVKRPESVPVLQSCASIGQISLMSRFKEVFDKYGLICGEILLSADDFSIRSRYLNLRNTIKTLISCGVVSVINENDSINIEELKLGDNDHLSSLIAIMLDFDQLIILTDVDGFYDKDPKKHADAKLIVDMETVDDSHLQCAGDACSPFSIGGMKSKLVSASKAALSGVQVFIGNGITSSLVEIVEGKARGTYIKGGKKLSARKKWIAFAPSEHAVLIVDEGAMLALTTRGASLLPSGIIGVEGDFFRGALVKIHYNGKKIAQGLTNYSSEEIERIKGLKSNAIKGMISDYYEEVIHKSNLHLPKPSKKIT